MSYPNDILHTSYHISIRLSPTFEGTLNYLLPQLYSKPVHCATTHCVIHPHYYGWWLNCSIISGAIFFKRLNISMSIVSTICISFNLLQIQKDPTKFLIFHPVDNMNYIFAHFLSLITFTNLLDSSTWPEIYKKRDKFPSQK